MSKKTLMHLFPSMLIFAWLMGCSHYPLGMDEKTWERLPQQEKIRLMKLDAERRQRERIAELEAEKEKARLQAEIEKEKLRAWQALFRNLRYGQVIRLNFLQGELYAGGRYRALLPDSFTLPIGAEERLALHRRDSATRTIWARYEPGKVTLCEEKPTSAYELAKNCRILIDSRWERGETYAIDLPQQWSSKPLLRRARILIKALPVAP